MESSEILTLNANAACWCQCVGEYKDESHDPAAKDDLAAGVTATCDSPGCVFPLPATPALNLMPPAEFIRFVSRDVTSCKTAKTALARQRSPALAPVLFFFDTLRLSLPCQTSPPPPSFAVNVHSAGLPPFSRRATGAVVCAGFVRRKPAAPLCFRRLPASSCNDCGSRV